MPLGTNCVTLMGGLLFGLGFGVSMVRGSRNKLGIVPQDSTDILFKIQRAHGNTAGIFLKKMEFFF